MPLLYVYFINFVHRTLINKLLAQFYKFTYRTWSKNTDIFRSVSGHITPLYQLRNEIQMLKSPKKCKVQPVFAIIAFGCFEVVSNQ